MRQFLVVLGSVAFLCCWVAAWGVLATGSLKAGIQYVRLWLYVMAGIVAVSGAVMLIAWPFMP